MNDGWIFQQKDLAVPQHFCGLYMYFLLYCVFISSTADIVSRAYLMLSRLAAVCVSTFFKSNRLRQFSSDLSNIWRECAQQYCPISCWSRILSFCFQFFSWISNCKKKKISKNGNFGGLWPFYQECLNTGPWNLLYRHIVGTCRCLKNGSCGPNFRDVFCPKYGQNKSIYRVFFYFLEKFLLDSLETWFTSSLEQLW